jgi:hypothetical protein
MNLWPVSYFSRAMKTSSLSIISRLAGGLLSLVLAKVLIEEYGLENYGIMATALTALSVASILEYSVGSGLRIYVARSIKANPWQIHEAIAKEIRRMSWVVSPLFALSIAGVFVPHQNQVISLVSSAILGISIYLPLFAWLRALEGTGETATFYTLQTAGSVVGFLVTSAFARMGIGVEFTVVSLVATGPMFSILLARNLVKKSLKSHEEMVNPRSVSPNLVPEVNRLASRFFMVGLGGTIAWSFHPVIAIAAIGEGAAAEVSIAMRLTQVCLSAVTGLYPMLVVHYSTDDEKDGVSSRFLQILGAIMSAALIPMGYLTCSWLGIPFGITLYVGSAFFILITAFQLNLSARNSEGKGIGLQSITMFVMAIVNIPMAYYMSLRLGASGPIIASCATYLVLHVIPLKLSTSRKWI